MAYVIIGATGGLGRALAARLAADGCALILVARDGDALAAMAGELKQDHGAAVTCVAADITRGTQYLDDVAEAARKAGGIDGLLLPIGLALRDGLGTAPETLHDLAAVNFIALAQAITRLWPQLDEGAATVVGFGSITAVRGRGRNFVYGAAKRALQAYFESLRIAARGTSVRVQFWVLGFIDTDAMRHEKTPLPKGDPKELADKVVAALGKKSCVAYFPGWWRPVTAALKALPWGIYARAVGGR